MNGIDAARRPGFGLVRIAARWFAGLARSVAARPVERSRRIDPAEFSPRLRRDVGLPDDPADRLWAARSSWLRY